MTDFPERRWLALGTAVAFSLLFLVVFPYLAMVSFMSFKVFDSGAASIGYGLLLIALLLTIPLSILFSLFSIWSSYLKKSFGRLYFYCGLPFIVMVFVWALISGLEILQQATA